MNYCTKSPAQGNWKKLVASPRKVIASAIELWQSCATALK